MRADRLVALVLLLRQRGRLTATTLARELEVSTRDFLRENMPFLDLQQIVDSGRTVGVVGLLGLVFTGVRWVDAIRSSQRAIWHLNQHPGYIVWRQLVDLAVLEVVLVAGEDNLGPGVVQGLHHRQGGLGGR